jgi:hypothetical protein
MTGTVPRINLTYRGQYGHTGLSSPEVVGPFFFYVHGCTRTNEWAVLFSPGGREEHIEQTLKTAYSPRNCFSIFFILSLSLPLSHYGTSPS